MRWSWKAATVLAAGGLGGAAAVAVATVPDSTGMIHACVNVVTAGGVLVPNTTSAVPDVTVIDPSAGQHCIAPDGTDTQQTTLSWNASGPRGPVGPTGPAGKPGTGTSTVTYTIVPPTSGPNAAAEGGATFGTGAQAIKFNVLSYGLVGAGGAGTGAGRVSKQSFVVTKFVDKSSNVLYRAVLKGTHYAAVTLEIRKRSGDTQEFLTFKMNNVVITSDQTGSTKSGQRPTETLTLNFTKIEFKTISR